MKVITEYLKRILKFPDQTLDQPSLLVTASTGKATTNINGITQHSAFHLPVKTVHALSGYHELSDEVLHSMRNKYRFLKVLIVD